jgi:outer membrane protein TolC
MTIQKNIPALLFFLFFASQQLIAQHLFTRLDDLWTYAQSKNISLKSGEIKRAQAQKGILAAKLNIIDPTLNTNSSFTNNTQLPVNLFPAEAFGGQPGTYREIQAGVKYVTNLNQYAEVKLLNLGAWESLKLAKINIDLTTSDNKITLKNLYDNVASAYFNIVNLQEQLAATQQNITAAETLLRTAQNRYDQGLVKQQDVNDAKASLLNTAESSRQLAFLIKQNELTLKILCDVPENEVIEIKQVIETQTSVGMPAILLNDLNTTAYSLKEKYALTNLQQLKKAELPTLSFVVSNTFQKNNTTVFDSNTKWITSNYVGLKLGFNLPSSKSITQKTNAQFDYQLAQKNTEHIKIKTALEQKQLGTDYEKALSQAKANQEIYALRKDTYDKNKVLYTEGLLSIDQTINSYNAMVNAHFSLISAQISVQLAQSKIDINNKIK